MKPRIDDILTAVGTKIISLDPIPVVLGDAAHPGDPYASLKHATLDPSSHTWRRFDVGPDVSIEDLCVQYRRDAQDRFSFPVKARPLTPA